MSDASTERPTSLSQRPHHIVVSAFILAPNKTAAGNPDGATVPHSPYGSDSRWRFRAYCQPSIDGYSTFRGTSVVSWPSLSI